MGIARFYRWFSERFPLVNETLTSEQTPTFDNLYLDINVIIHHCSRNDSGCLFQTESDLFVSIFQYICHLVDTVKPTQLLYIAVDGVAPRAKINQQRVRRYRSAKDRQTRLKRAKAYSSPWTFFDSNCITPGTEFMTNLTDALDFCIQYQLNENELWSGLNVILSGPDVPGEGEHKIMDYIRRSKSQPDHNPNTRHCLYGLDADLIMLALASHEPHFCLLREEIELGTGGSKSKLEKKTSSKIEKFVLFHLGILREYLEIEFCVTPQPTKEDNDSSAATAETSERRWASERNDCSSTSQRPDENRAALLPEPLRAIWSLERVIDDFILFCFLSGNDFLPHLPFTEIGAGGLHQIMAIYRAYVHEQVVEENSKDPWITGDCGTIQWPNFYRFMQKWGHFEKESLEVMIDDAKYLRSKMTDRDRTVRNDRANDLMPPTMAGNNVGGDLNGYSESDCVEGEVCLTSFDEGNFPQSLDEMMEQYYSRKCGIDIRTDLGQQELDGLLQTYLEGLQWNLWYYYRGTQSWSWFYKYYYPPYVQSLLKYPAFVKCVLEKVLPVFNFHEDNRMEIVANGVQINRGLKVLPCFAFSANLNIKFELGDPLTPLQQLMSVLPPQSITLVPDVYKRLMLEAPLSAMYPTQFSVDMEGAKVPWGGVAILPFMDVEMLQREMKRVDSRSRMTEEEEKRNRVGQIYHYKLARTGQGHVPSPLPDKFRSIESSLVVRKKFRHPSFPTGCLTFKNYPLEGHTNTNDEFPTLKVFHIERAYFDVGIILFNGMPARNPGLHLVMKSAFCAPDLLQVCEGRNEPGSPSPPVEDPMSKVVQHFRQILTSPIILVDYPFKRVAKPIGLWSPHFYFRTAAAHGAAGADCRQEQKDWRRRQENDVYDDESSSRRDYLIPSPPPSLHLASKLSEMAYEQSRKMGWNGLHVFGIGDSDEVFNSGCAGIAAAVLRRCIQDGLPQCRAPPSVRGGRSSGATFDLNTIPNSISFSEVLVEVLIAEETVRNKNGTVRSRQFAFHPSYRLLPMVHLPPQSFVQSITRPMPTAASAVFPLLRPGMTVMCRNPNSPLFGCVGTIESIGSCESDVVSIIPYRWERYDTPWQLQRDVSSEMDLDRKRLQWFTINHLARYTCLPVSVLSRLLKSFFITGEDRVRYDIGMNLVALDKSTGEALCLPCYSFAKYVPDGANPNAPRLDYDYSTLALKALQDYKRAYPNVFHALVKAKREQQMTSARALLPDAPELGGADGEFTRFEVVARGGAKDGFVTASDIFPASSDPGAELEELSRWLMSQPYSRQQAVVLGSEAITPKGILAVEAAVDKALKASPISKMLLYGTNEIWPIEVSASLPDSMYAASSVRFREVNDMQHQGCLQISQRVVYGKWNGVLPFGTAGTVTRTSFDKKAGEQIIELVIDIPHLGSLS